MLCAGETGTMSWRHPPHRAGVASHAALESGVVVRAGARDALTEAGAGGVVSRAMATRWGADLVTGHGRPQPLPRHARGRGDLARSEPPARPLTPCTGTGKARVSLPPIGAQRAETSRQTDGPDKPELNPRHIPIPLPLAGETHARRCVRSSALLGHPIRVSPCLLPRPTA